MGQKNGAMLLPPIKSVFRNRWWTLLWAGAICFSAIEFAGGSENGDGGNAAGKSEAVGDAMNALSGLP
jgi:hypothetical protein